MELAEIQPGVWMFQDPALTPEMDEDFNDELDLAQTERATGRGRLACDRLHALLMRYPDHIDALHHLSLWYGRDGRKVECLAFCLAAVGIGLHAIPSRFRWDRGEISWRHLENRPFHRAYQHLALLRMQQERWDDSIEILTRLLSINPDDHMGVRILLPKCWFETKDIPALLAHCRIHRDGWGPDLPYASALALILDGQEARAEAELADCVRHWPLVAAELLRKRHARLRTRAPDEAYLGGKQEAWEYWEYYGRYWESSPRAMALLREARKRIKSK